MLIEVDGDPAAFAPRLRALVADIEPGLILDEVILLDDLPVTSSCSTCSGPESWDSWPS